MAFFKSIRWGLQIWHGLILLAVLSGFGITAWRLQQQRAYATAGERLQERYNIALRLIRQGGSGPENPRPRPGPGRDGDLEDGPPGAKGHFPPPHPLGDGPPRNGPPGGEGPPERLSTAAEQALKADEAPGSTVTIWRRDGGLLVTTGGSSTTPDIKGPMPRALLSIQGNVMELLGTTPPGEIIRVTRDISAERHSLQRTAWQLAAAATSILLLGLAGGWWAAGRTLRPIADISATAAHLSAGNLGQRLSVKDTHGELGQLATTLNAMFARLEDSFTQQTRFISDAAHELRTPVSVMLTQTQTALRRERPAEEYRTSLEACQRAAGRMRQLIESLLALARLDGGQQQMKRLRFDLAHALREQTELLAPLATARDITFNASLAESLTVEGDPDYLTMAAANLLTNAIHYNREGGAISVQLTTESNQALLTIADTGQGMSPEQLSHIFERFYRADQSRSLPAGRTGLGLAITKSIIEAHHGAITVQSTPGEGTSFTLRIPLEALPKE